MLIRLFVVSCLVSCCPTKVVVPDESPSEPAPLPAPLSPSQAPEEGATIAPAESLNVTRVDLDRYREFTELVLEADLSDSFGRTIALPDGASVGIAIDEVAVPADVNTTTYGDGRPIAIGLLLPAHNSYQPLATDEPPLALSGLVAAGLADIAERAPPGSMTCAWVYDESGTRELARFDFNGKVVAERVAEFRPTTPQSKLAPSFYQAIERVVGSFEKYTATLPARRVLVIVSDGLDALTEQQRKPLMQRLYEGVAGNGIETHIIGATLGPPEWLAPLVGLSVESKGTYRVVPFERMQALGDEVAAVGQAINNRLVLRITPREPIAKGPHALRVDVTTRDGKRVSTSLQVAIPAR